MLVVKVELWSNGDGSQARELGKLLIGNQGSNARGSFYAAHGFLDPWLMKGRPAEEAQVWKFGPYNREQNVWHLVRAILDEMKGNWKETK